MFDFFEHNMPQSEQNLIGIVPDYRNTQWYNFQVKDLIYENEALKQYLGVESLNPPVQEKVVLLALYSNNITLTDEYLGSGGRPSVVNIGAINFNAAKYVDGDFVDLKNQLANMLIAKGKSNAAIEDFLKVNHVPSLGNGTYALSFNYRLPGKEIQTSTVSRQILVKE